jgi:HK97 family phage prohead protease
MAERLHRAFRADLEVRSDGRTIVGIVVPFDEETRIVERGRTYTEVFRRSAFDRTIAERGPEAVKLLALHNRDAMPLGRATLLRPEARGLYGEFHVSRTAAGDEALALVNDGAVDAFSIGFRPIPSGDRWNPERTRVERTEVALREVSLVPWGAYAGAVIEGVRTAPRLSTETARRRLEIHVKDWNR